MKILLCLLFLLQSYSAYLFTYFTGNDQKDESIHYAISFDGLNFRALNGNKPVLDSDAISETGGVRDPHILRREDGKGFYMMATDMTSSKGWDSNRGMVLLSSPDLIHWSSSAVNIQKSYSGQEDLLRVWAPQTIYDRKEGKYLIYWSMKHGENGKDIIYYAYANEDFTALESEPKVFFTPKDGESCIDGDIIEKDGIYHLFYKTEGHGDGIRMATTRNLTGNSWSEREGYVQPTDMAVEGAGTYKLIGEDCYVLMYDCYKNGKYHITTSSDLEKFTLSSDKNHFDFKPRHGTVMAITGAEAERLIEEYAPKGIKMLAWSDPKGTEGLKLAWSLNGENWVNINESDALLKSDFGSWSGGKKMFGAALRRLGDGSFECRFKANEEGSVTGRSTSRDLILWSPQEYDHSSIEAGASITDISCAELCKVTDFLRKMAKDRKVDALKLSSLKAPASIDMNIRIKASEAKAISDKLYGIFFEDINCAADGGLYAELVRNRDFEFNSTEKKRWNATTGWEFSGAGSYEVLSENPIHNNNPHYIHVGGGVSLVNKGWDGMKFIKGDEYIFSMFVRGKGRVEVALVDNESKVLGSAALECGSDGWEKVKATLTALSDCPEGRLMVSCSDGVSLDMDMISLFPARTFKGHGLREDIAQALADMKPSFVRFPGGCVAHGNGVDNIYDWKGSIGALEERKPLRNIWNYHQTRGLGYFEYFQFCEDIGAEPLPVLAAGVPCQNSNMHSHHSCDDLTTHGQQCGIPMEEMDAYVQDILDLIEYANGPASSKWGAKRAEAGHPKPFGLKYLGIGNEDMITPVFKERFEMIYKAVRARYPQITIIGTVGPFHSGSDYEYGWEYAREMGLDMVDEHYYVSPGWLKNNRNFYDSYDRKGPKVYLGEYAAHRSDRRSTMETALAEALYLCDVERNADVVSMTSYAPLLSRKNWVNWDPDLLWFDSCDIYPTTSYWTQKLFSRNAGDRYLPSQMEVLSDESLDEWQLKHLGVSCVKDSRSGDTIVKLVNSLPSEVNVNIDGLRKGAGCKISVQTGKPDSRAAAAPQEYTKKYDGKIVLPPYSVTVIRIYK